MRNAILFFVLALIMGCKVTNNYYSIYPTKVIETKMPTLEGDVIYPSRGIDPGFYKPIPYGITVPGYMEKPIYIDTTLRFRFN